MRTEIIRMGSFFSLQNGYDSVFFADNFTDLFYQKFCVCFGWEKLSIGGLKSELDIELSQNRSLLRAGHTESIPSLYFSEFRYTKVNIVMFLAEQLLPLITVSVQVNHTCPILWRIYLKLVFIPFIIG